MSRLFPAALVVALAALCAPLSTSKAWAGAVDPPAQVVVLTSYPDAVTTAYQRAFEAAYPGSSVSIIWAHSADAMRRLQQADGGGVDVYWTPSPASFVQLAQQGRLVEWPVDRQQLPGRIGSQWISDPRNRYQAFEVAGYGMAVNTAKLDQLGLPVPTRWTDLAEPAYAGRVAWPDPSRVGFAPALYDIVLQAQGWQQGWALLSEAVSQGTLGARPGQAVDEVASGRTPIGVSVDFMVRSAAANGLPVRMVYPDRTAFLPAQVAVLKQAPHAEAALAFARFVLSAPGQLLLFQPDIARYPVRPAVYAQAPAGTFDPFQRPADSGFPYDPALSQARSGLVVAVFNTMLGQRQAQLAPLWKRLHEAEAADAAHPQKARQLLLAQVRQLLGEAPVSAGQANDAALQALFQRADDSMKSGSPSADQQAVLARWNQQLDAHLQQAAQLLAGLPAP